MSDTTRQYTLATNNDGSGKVKIGLIPERTIPYVDHLKELDGLRAENEQLLERYPFHENQRKCIGYGGGCDGDLEATEHEENCPARTQDLVLRSHIYTTPEPINTEELLASVAIVEKEDLLAASLAESTRELQALRAQLRSKDEQLAGMRDALENLRGAFVVLCENHRTGPVDPNFFSRYREAKVALSGPSPAQEGTP